MQNLSNYYQYFQENQNSSLPFAIEFDSGIPGPNVMYVGSTHGSEPAGTIANIQILQALKSGKISLKKGKLVFVLGNPEAFKNSTRFVEANLNRVFSEEIASGLEGQRAKEFRDYFKTNHIDYLIDLHSVSVGDFQFVIYFHNSETQQAALEFSPIGTHFLANQESIPGTLLEEARRNGGEGFVIECGNHNDPKTIEAAKYHIISSMIYLKMIDVDDYALPKVSIAKEVYVYNVFDTIKPQTDFQFTNSDTTTGTFVKKGDIYATFKLGQYTAKQDLYIVMPDLKPRVDDHDAGFLCTREILPR